MHTVFVCKQLLSGIRFRGGVDVFVKTTRIGQISGPRQIERGRLWQSSLMGKKTNLSLNELRAGAHLKSHGKIYQGFYIQLVSLIQIQLDAKSWTTTAKRIIWTDTQHPPHNNPQHGYFVKFAFLLEIWNGVVFRWRSIFFCVDICQKKVGRSEWWTPVFMKDSPHIHDHANSYPSIRPSSTQK